MITSSFEVGANRVHLSQLAINLRDNAVHFEGSAEHRFSNLLPQREGFKTHRAPDAALG